jgi:CelD/BcsL family acetyltransferase involved in cellulose biosynthesis
MTTAFDQGIRDRRRRKAGVLSRLWHLFRRDHVGRLGLGQVQAKSNVVVEVFRDATVIEKEWRALEETAVETPFQTYAFCSGWYRAAATGGLATPLVITVRHNVTGELLVILPFALSQRGPFQVISFADLGMADINLPIIAPSLRARTEEARHVLFAALSALPDADYFELDKMPASYADGTINPLILKRGVLHKENGIHHIPLHHPWDVQAKSIQSKSFRRNVARCLRGLAQEGSVCVRVPDAAEDIDQAFEQAFELRKSRFQALDRGNVLTNPELKAFYQALLHAPREGLHARITVLEVDGVQIASDYGLVWQGVEHLVLPAVSQDERWRRHSPGHIVMDALFAKRAEAGDRRVSLGVGDDAYKSQIGTVRRELYTLRRDLSLRGAVFEAGDDLANRLRKSDVIRGFYKRHVKGWVTKSNPTP